MVVPDDVAAELGRPLPLSATTTAQWQGWIDRTYRTIERRAERVGVDYATLDAALVDDVVLLAVTTHARNPSGVDTKDVSVDDGRVSTRYQRSAGEITVDPEWWTWLFPDSGAGVFSTRLEGEPDAAPYDPWVGA